MSDSLPKGWIRTTLGEVAEWGAGGTPSRNVPAYFGGSIPWIKTGELGAKYITGAEEFITEKAVEESSAKVFPKGSVGIAMYGATIGKTSIWGIDAATNQACAVAQPKRELLDSIFLYYFLLSQKHLFIDRGKGGAQRNISQTLLKNWPIPLPPLNEQRRIVAKIEELFSELEAGVAALEQARAQLKRYRQALLKAAFEGRLTQAWRQARADELEPAEALLARIKAEREARWRQQLAEWEEEVQAWEAAGKPGKKPRKPRKPKELPPLSEEELAALPERWAWVRLGEIAEILGGVTKGRKLDGKRTVKLPYLRVANVQDGYLDLSVVKEIEVLPDDLKKYRLLPGDILYTEGGDKDKLGRGTVWEGQIENCIHQNHIFRARVSNEFFNPKYVAYYSQTQAAKRYFFRRGKQTTNLASINMTVLSSLPFPLIPKQEQDRIMAALEMYLSTVDYLDQTIEQALEQATALRHAILKKAFTGQLVPQDANDEPASVLLERMRGERENHAFIGRRQSKGKELVT